MIGGGDGRGFNFCLFPGRGETSGCVFWDLEEEEEEEEAESRSTRVRRGT